MSEVINQNATTTGEPVKEQAPAPNTESKSETTTTPTQASATSEGKTPAASLPSGYLVTGSMLDSDGVILPEYIGEYAEKLAQALKPLSANSFQRAFLSKAREASKKKVAYSAKKNCALGMVISAKKLIHRAKDPAPAVLLEMIQAATATVTDPAAFEALYMHLDAICTYMLCE